MDLRQAMTQYNHPTAGGVNPSLTIQALACRIGDRITALARRGELAG